MSERLPNQPNRTVSPEYAIFHNRETMPYNQPLVRWPLHITIAPPFTLERPDALSSLRELIRDIAEDYSPIQLTPGPKDMFGHDELRPVTRLHDHSGELQRLHEQLLWGLGLLGCSAMDGRFVLNNFNPHITDIPSVPVTPESFALSSLTLVEKSNGVKRLVDTVGLV